MKITDTYWIKFHDNSLVDLLVEVKNNINKISRNPVVILNNFEDLKHVVLTEGKRCSRYGNDDNESCYLTLKYLNYDEKYGSWQLKEPEAGKNNL